MAWGIRDIGTSEPMGDSVSPVQSALFALSGASPGHGAQSCSFSMRGQNLLLSMSKAASPFLCPLPGLVLQEART